MTYRLVFTVNTLKDAVAFESLAEELGVNMQLVNIEHDQGSPEPKGKRHRVTDVIIKKVKNEHRKNPGATADSIKRITGLPHSRYTVGKIMAGYYD